MDIVLTRFVAAWRGLAPRNWVAHRSLRRILSNPLGGPALFILCLVVVAGLFAPWLAPYPPDAIHAEAMTAPPSAQFWLGTDEIGRDILSRIIFGAQVSLRVVLLSVTLSLVCGSILGLVAGYFGGVVEATIMRIMDALMAFPMLVLALALALAIISFLGPSVNNAILAIGIVNVPKFCRLVRGEALSVKQKEYILAARSIGMSDFWLILFHLWPNVMGSVIVFSSLAASQALITESALSFLGLGVQPPDPSWGAMIAAGMGYWTYWWISFFPGLAIFLTVLSLNVLGDALRDALDPRLTD
jgi:peptide/nickel transport system permease protein